MPFFGIISIYNTSNNTIAFMKGRFLSMNIQRITINELAAAFGIFLGIGLVAFVSKSTDDNLLLAPFGATSVIAFLVPESDFAQPRNIILGYTITSAVGLSAAFVIGHNWFSYALAVAAAMLVKSLFNAVHPPSAAMPIILLHSSENGILYYVLHDVLPGICLLVFVAIIYNKYVRRLNYPWWTRSKRGHKAV